MSKNSLKIASLFLALSSALPAMADDAKPYAGQHLTVLMPPWGALPAEMTQKFEQETGIDLDLQVLGWDQIHTKIVTSMLAGTAPADVTEVDWSWVGQLASAGWYVPLNGKVPDATFGDIPASRIFTVDGNTISVPWNNDFRLLIINKKQFADAGIAEAPKTLDELLADAKQIKQKGIAEYPIAIPLSPSEGTSTTWYLLTHAYGGEIFDKDYKPLFTDKDSAGYKAFAWLIGAFKDGLIDPGSTGMTDVQVQEFFKNGKASIDLNGWVGNLAVYADASKTKVAGDVSAVTFPSQDGKVHIFGLPDGLGIPNPSEHKEAALAFINWLTKPENELALQASQGDLPTRTSLLTQLNQQGKFPIAPAILAKVPSVEPFFPQGAPSWYPQFSAAVSTAVNRAAKGQLTVDQAINQIAADSAKAAEQ